MTKYKSTITRPRHILCNRDNDKNRYKTLRILDDKSKWVIIDGDGFIINKNPTNEELKSAKNWTFKHNSTETCYRCNKSFDEVPGHPEKEKDEYRRWMGIWDCHACWQKYDPNSNYNKRKLESDCRNNNLDPNSPSGVGYITAMLVKKFLGIEDCFGITDNFNYPKYDMIEHEDWGKIDAKGSSLRIQNNSGSLGHIFNSNNNEEADHFFCIGYDKDRKHVIVIYIVPNENNIVEIECITIPYNRYSKYHKYKENEEEIKKWDELFHTLKLDNCPVLRPNS